MERFMFAFARFDLFMAIRRIIPFGPALGKIVSPPAGARFQDCN